MTKSLPPLAFVALCMLVGVACGREQPEPQAVPASIVVVDQAGYGKELRDHYGGFRWPPDFRPDVDRLVTATQPAPAERVQSGVARTVLNVVNSCAWYLSWDTAHSRADHQAIGDALQVMTDVLTTFPPPADPVGKEFVERVAAQAEIGDPEPARQYVATNCPEIVWVAAGN
ncbi:MAG: hypothetical protein ABW215_06950 [Kibdelosporangium sp.]